MAQEIIEIVEREVEIVEVVQQGPQGPTGPAGPIGPEGPAGGVPESRTISSGSGLIGGGDLSEDRTISVNFGTTSGTVAAGDHTHSNATITTAGFMSATDKEQIDSLFPSVKNPTIYLRRFANFQDSGFNGDTSNLNSLTTAQLNARGYYLIADDYFEWDPVRWAFTGNNFTMLVYIECGGIFNDGIHIHFRRRNISSGTHVGFTGTMENGHIQTGSSNSVLTLSGTGNALDWSGSPARERIEVWMASYNGGNGGFVNNFVYKVL